MVVVKDISITPDGVSNDGGGAFEIRCTVFSQNEDCVITEVGMDLRHTLLDNVFPLRPDRDNVLRPSMEGLYKGRLEIPRLMDSGHYRLPILAKDSKEGEGVGISRFHIEWNPGAPPAIKTRAFADMQEVYGEYPFVDNNYVESLEEGEAALAKRFEMIESAEKQINVQTYNFEGTGAGGKLMDALLKKADQGVEVNVILNTDTSFPSSPLSLLRLKANQLFYEWAWGGKENEDGEEKPDSFWDRLLPRRKSGGLNLALFSGRSVGVPANPASKAHMVDHWLARMMDDKESKPDQSKNENIATYDGPGGLPSLPLLDYAIHEKIMVVDGARAIVGGRNLEGKYFQHWKDLDLYVEGPVVDQIQAGFFRSFSETADPDNRRHPTPIFNAQARAPGVPVQFVQSRPWAEINNVLLTMVNAIAACRSTFFAVSQYLVLPGSMLRDAILEAAARGVDIRILTNSARTCSEVGFSTAYYVTLNYLDELLDAGVRIYEARGFPDEKEPQPYLHNKEFIFDSHLAAVGSFNLSMRSSHIESENLLYVCDDAFAHSRTQAFLHMIESQADEITKEHLEHLQKNHKTRIEMSRHLELLF